MTDVAANYKRIRGQVDEACETRQTTPENVLLVAVSKGQPIEKLKQAYDAGVRDFGESYVDEWREKVDALPDDVRWHFIGPIQSRTLKSNIDLFQKAHSIQVVSREKIARILNEGLERPVDILIQVNVGDEEQKSGVSWDGLPSLIEYIDTCSNLRLRGLMAIPPFSEDPETTKSYFTQMAEGFENVWLERGSEFNQLSMGMSGDFHLAIPLGATVIRVGTAIFGARNG